MGFYVLIRVISYSRIYGSSADEVWVRNKLCWDAYNAVGLPIKTKELLPVQPDFPLLWKSHCVFAFQHNLFRTMWRIEQKAYLQQLFCCIFYGIVCTWRHQILKSKTKKPPKVLFSSGISTKCISLHLSSLIASFVWKPTHFEFRSYVPVKSKLQHPTPGKPPGIWIFGKFLFKFPPSPGRKAVQMPPPSGTLSDCFNFSDTLTCHEPSF